MVDRPGWILLFLEAPSGPYPTDQIRVMKGMFLAGQIPGHPVSSLYAFDPYDYGPFDSTVYRDLDKLQLAGLIAVERSPGSARRNYALTPLGRDRARSLKGELPLEQVTAVADAKKKVTCLGFDDLLRQIYSEYPTYATQSVARVARSGSQAIGGGK